MPSGCCAPRCTNSNKDGYCLTTLGQDPQLKQKWIDAAGEPDWQPTKSARLCEVHFHPSAVYCVGKRKFIEKSAIPTFFCKCHKSVQRTPLLEIQSNVQQCDKLFEYPYKRVFSNMIGQENKRSQENKDVNESREYNYSRESTLSHKKKYTHISECIIKKKPIAIDTLKQVVYERENTESNSVLAQDINTLPESITSTTSKIVFTESLPSPETLTLLKKKVESAETENKTLKSQIKCLEEKVEEYSCIINKVLNNDQHNAVLRGTTRGSTWSDETIKKGLHLQFACGSHGYKKITELVAPFPSVRTLRRRIQHIKFEPGILDDILTYLELVVPYIPSRWRICGLVFDEMAIQPKLEFDISTGMYIGNVTLPNTDKLACKVLVFQLFGLGFHWKQYVAYHFTTSSSMNDAFKDIIIIDIIIEILQKCHHVGLKVIVLVCDMGNRGVLTKMGFKTTKTDMVYAVTHPCDPELILQLIPDPVHVFKNLKEMFMEHQIIYLSQDIVDTYELSSNIVDVGHIEWLESYQSEHYEEVKLAPKLNKNVLKSSHFSGMKVANSTSVINHATASALTFLVQKGDGLREMETTAWFIRLITKWFDIMTGRKLCHALSFHNREEYHAAIQHLKLICHVFRNMKVGCGQWKPSQTHVILTTESMIQLQDRLLNEEEFTFFFPGRASQDSLENGFSNIRRGCSKPTALQFKSRLRQICVIGGDQAIPTSSYSYDETPSLITVLLMKLDTNENEQTIETHTDFPKLNDCEPMSEHLKQIFYRMCGYVVFKLRRSIKCEACYLKLQDNSEYTYTPTSLAAFVDISDYTRGAQIRVSPEVFYILEGVERIIWKIKSRVLLLGKSLNNKFVSHCNIALEHLPLSTCHNIKQTLISRFVSMRLKQLSIHLSNVENENVKISSAFASKTMGAGLLADRFKRKKYARK